MNTYARTSGTYLAQRVMGASPEQQAALIMEAGQLHVGRAVQALAREDMAATVASLIRASEVIMEATLRLDVDGGGELVGNLLRLYDHWGNEMRIAGRTRDIPRLQAIARDMGEIRTAWEQLHEKKVREAPSGFAALGDRVV